MLNKKVLLDAMTGFPNKNRASLSPEFIGLQKKMKSLQSLEGIRQLARQTIDTEIDNFIKKHKLTKAHFTQDQIDTIRDKRNNLANDFEQALKEKYLKSEDFNSGEKYGKGVEKFISPFVETLSKSVRAEMRGEKTQKREGQIGKDSLKKKK